MNRPPLEVADVIRAAGSAFRERARLYFDRQHWKALHAILHCRTAALGGHIDQCSGCGKLVLSYNWCRNRSCPKCPGHARHRWLRARRAELLPTRYVHVVLLSLTNCALRGGLAPDGSRWVRPRYDFFLPVKAVAKAFRGKFREALQAAFAAGELRFPGQLSHLAAPRAFAELIRLCFRKKWVVYAKRPFGGPEHVLEYLGNYTHRIAISNHRLLGLEGDKISFRWRDSAHKNKPRVMALRLEEFLRRYFLPVLPPGFVRIRHFGLFAHRLRKVSLETCRRWLDDSGAPLLASTDTDPAITFWACPDCGAPMVLMERRTPTPT